MDDDAKRIGPTRRTQVLASGLTIRQDFRDAVRFAFFETKWPGWPYGTHGGTVFVVNYRGKCYGLTAGHVRQDFDWSQLIVTEKKVGTKRAPLRGIYYPSSPRDEAIGSDILDIVVLEFIEPITCEFFEGSAYIIDSKTVASSADGHSLLVSGNLKEQTDLTEDIAPGYGLLQFTDTGLSGSDKTLRQATAQYRERRFESIVGLSGAPVYDQTANALGGMVVRAGPMADLWRIHFVDIFDIMQLLDAVHSGKLETYYRKTITVRTLVKKG